MKSNDRLLAAGTAAYSYLFYEQNAGINFLIFNLVFISMLLYRDKNLLQNKTWLLAAGMCLLSATGIVLHSSALAMIANVFGLLLLSSYSFNRATSSVFSFLFSFYSVVSSFIYVIIDASKRSVKNSEKEDRGHSQYKYFILFVVCLLCILFFALYRKANPLFAENTQWVNFNFISFTWLLFSGIGFLAVYGLFYHKTLPQVDAWENGIRLKNVSPEEPEKNSFKSELSAGVLLFTFLNLMLVILNAGDINSIWFKGSLPKGVSHSDFVHNGVSMIIFSILIATGLIMFLYRYNFAALKNSKLLKLLVYAWIAQNLLMLFSTACRNQIYIQDYNLTYKRVGVYVWLFLAMMGLVVTAIKVKQDQSNWYLIRSNFNVWFFFLAFSSILNWDVLITRHNLSNQPLTKVDFHYLFSLSDANIPELLAVTKDKDFHLINGRLRDYSRPSSYTNNTKTYRTMMKTKIKYYLKEYKADWQSWDFRDKHIIESLVK